MEAVQDDDPVAARREVLRLPGRAVPLELLEQVNLVGPASYVQERIAAFRESGVTNLQVAPLGDDPAATVRQLKEWVS